MTKFHDVDDERRENDAGTAHVPASDAWGPIDSSVDWVEMEKRRKGWVPGSCEKMTCGTFRENPGF